MANLLKTIIEMISEIKRLKNVADKVFLYEEQMAATDDN